MRIGRLVDDLMLVVFVCSSLFSVVFVVLAKLNSG